MDCVGRRSDVCQGFWDLNDDDESENDGENVVVVVGIHLVEEDGWEWAERLELELVAVQGAEADFCCALGSCPQKPAYWIRPYPSSAASSPLY